MIASVTGTLHEQHDGKTYDLRLTMGGIAKLQAMHGRNVAGLLDGSAGDLPDFQALIDMVSVALQKGQGMTPEEAASVADDLLSADMEIVQRLITAAFPNATVETAGNVRRPKRTA